MSHLNTDVDTDIIHWKYDTMYKWYLKQAKSDHNNNNNAANFDADTIIPIIYSSQKVNKKNNTILEPFIKQHIVKVSKAPIQNSQLFPNGLFVVFDDNSSKKEWLYFVYPIIKKCETTKEILFADHFTFCIDSSDKLKPCHFHSTTYNCSQIVDYTNYTYQHEKDYLSNEIDIPRTGNVDTIINNIFHRGYKSVLLDIIRYPWNKINKNNTNPKTKNDGGSKTTKNRVAAVSRPILSSHFTHVWNTCKFKSMVAFGIKNKPNTTYTWSVSFLRKEREKKGQVYTSYNFETATADETIFQNTLAQFAAERESDMQ